MRSEMRRSGISPKAAVNHFLRLGLIGGDKTPRKRFVVHPLPLKLPAGHTYDNVEELLEALGPSPQVIILDASILLYAYDPTSETHDDARTWVEEVFSGRTLVGIPWQTAHAFLRVVTNPKLTVRRVAAEEAAQVVDSWVAQPNVRFLGPSEQHWNVLRRLMVEGQARGPLVSAAQLAALTIERGGELYTTDRDFARFPGLRWKNPLA
jgi:toxin-antitoxin system PIN domain toxin